MVASSSGDSASPTSDVTRLLRDGASSQLLAAVYDELRAIARRRMASERPGHTLQATALVNEAYLRLAKDGPIQFQNRRHFFAAAAEAMRRILVEHARAAGRVKRGGGKGGAQRIALDVGNVADLAAAGTADPEQIVALDDAIRRLEERDPTAGEVVRLRFFAGLSLEETAEVLGLSQRTVAREWAYARALLFRSLEDQFAGAKDQQGRAPDRKPDDGCH